MGKMFLILIHLLINVTKFTKLGLSANYIYTGFIVLSMESASLSNETNVTVREQMD